MPTYEYECGTCEHRFEKVLKITDDPEVVCPKCGAEAERLISGGAGLLFKGSGFYITDYRSPSYKQAAKKEEGGGGTASDTGSARSSDASSTSSGEKKKESSKDSD